MAPPNSSPNTPLDQLSDFRVDRLPLVSAFCHKIGIANSINAMIDSKADIDAVRRRQHPADR